MLSVWGDEGHAGNRGFSAMLADEYILIFYRYHLWFELTEYNSAKVHNFNSSFSIGFSCRLTEHGIPAQQKALTVVGNPNADTTLTRELYLHLGSKIIFAS